MKPLIPAAAALVAFAACNSEPSEVSDFDLTFVDGETTGDVDFDVSTDAATGSDADTGEQDIATDSPGETTEPDVRPDIGPDVSPDVGPDTPADTAVDVGPGDCPPGATRCDGQILVTCGEPGQAPGRRRCQADSAFCDASGTTAACVPWVCEPNSQFCDPSETRSLTCNEIGSDAAAAEACAAGCNASTGECNSEVIPTGCPLEYTELGPGEYEFNLCDYDAVYSHVTTDQCTSRSEADNDVLIRIVLDRAERVRLNLQDADPNVAIDTLLHVRSACDNRNTQVDCSDDIACEDQTIDAACDGDVQVRESSLELDLEAGEWFVVIESFVYNSFDCGVVRLEIDY